MALVTWMPRGQASVQLNVVRQRHTPSTSLRMSRRSAARLVAAVEDEPVGVDDRGRTEVRALAPVHRAARGAARAQDALGGVVVAGAVGLALDPLAGRRVAGGDQVRLDRAVGVEERLHVDHEVLLDGQAADRLDRDGELLAGLLGQHVAHQHLARQPVDAVDAHGIGAAHAVRARPPERQRAVEIPLDVVQQVEQPVTGKARHPEALPARAVGILRVEPGDLQRHHHRAVGDRRQRGILARPRALIPVLRARHQYFRSIGSYRVCTTGL